MKKMQPILWRQRPTGALVGAVHSISHNSLQGTYFHLSHKNIFSCAMVFCFLFLFALISNCMRLMGRSTLQRPMYLDSFKPSHWNF
jgi:hypothetical protein